MTIARIKENPSQPLSNRNSDAESGESGKVGVMPCIHGSSAINL